VMWCEKGDLDFEILARNALCNSNKDSMEVERQGFRERTLLGCAFPPRGSVLCHMHSSKDCSMCI